MREMDRETFVEKEVKPAATRRLERSLAMEEFARRENVEVKSEEVRSIYYSALQQLQQTQEQGKAQSKNRRSTQEMANSLAINTVNSVFNQRLMARLKAIAIGQGDETEIAQIFAAGEQLPTETEASSDMVEDSAATGEQAVGEENVQTEEPQQSEASVVEAPAGETAVDEAPAGETPVDEASEGETAADETPKSEA